MIHHFLFDATHDQRYEITDLFNLTNKGRFNFVNIGKRYISGRVFNLIVSPLDKGYPLVRDHHASLQVMPDEDVNARLVLLVPPSISWNWGSGVSIARENNLFEIGPAHLLSKSEFKSSFFKLLSEDEIYLRHFGDLSNAYGPIVYYTEG